jgi:hypothetical protein
MLHWLIMIRITYNRDGFSSETIEQPFQSRGDSAVRLFEKAWRTYPKEQLDENVKRVCINLRDTHDYYEQIQPGDRLFHITDVKEKCHMCFPCFNFDRWVEAKIPDFNQTVQQIRLQGQQPPIINKLFWIGANTHKNRMRLAHMARLHPNLMDACIMSWNSGIYVSLPDHTKYKYLIDMEGGGYSARIKYLLHANRLLFIQDRKHWDWCTSKLVPWEHYVPVQNDLSDLVEKLRWAMEHEEDAQQIIRNMNVYAQTYCTSEAVSKHIHTLMFEEGASYQP